MNVLRVGFVGTRTPQVEATSAFFRDVLGLGVVRDSPEWSIFQLPTGHFDFVEVYSPDFEDDRLAPAGAGLFVSFMVDDLEGAHGEVRASGADAGEIVWAAEAFEDPGLHGIGWFFVTAPDGNLYVIQHVPS